MTNFKSTLTGILLAAGALSAAAAAPTFYVYSGDMDGARPRGMHTLDANGEDLQLKWLDPLSYGDSQTPTAFNMESGWIRNGRLCGFMINYPSPSASGNLYVERDLNTGEVLHQYVLDVTDSNWTNYFLVATYSPVDDMVYGFGINADKTGFALKRAPASNLNQSVIISASKPMLNGMCYNSDRAVLAGVRCTSNGDGTYAPSLVEINPINGQETRIMTLEGDTDIDYPCPMGLAYVPSMKKYVWNLYSYQNVNGNLSTLVAIDPEKKTCETLAYYPAGYCFNYVIPVGDPGYANPNVPGAPEITSITTITNPNTCNVSFRLPTRDAEGKEISGTLSYTIADGSKVLYTGTSAAGATLTASKLQLEGEGIHYIRVVASNAAGEGVPAVQAYYLGVEPPRQVENIVLTDQTLTWDPVTKGMYGGTLSNVQYDVYINDTFVDFTTATSLDISSFIPKEGPMRAYRAYITPMANSIAGEAATSNKIVAGTPLSLPASVTPTASEFDVCLMEDADGDGVGWSAYNDSETGTPYLLSGYNNLKATEDWIFLPPVKAEKGMVSLSMLARMAQEGLKLGEISVYAGTAPNKAAMTMPMLPALRLSTTDEQTLSADLHLTDATSPLYFGICVRSGVNMLSPVTVRDIKITQTSTDLAIPEAPTVKEFTKDDTGRKVVFTLPSKNLDGTPITAAEVTVKVNSYRREITVKGAPGSEGTAAIATPHTDNLITLTPYIGAQRGMAATQVLRLGAGVPGMIRNLRVIPDAANTTVTLEWDAPNTNAEGEAIDGGQFSYRIWQINEEGQYQLAVEVPYPLTHANTYISDNTGLNNIQIGITTVSDEGEGAMHNELIQIGTPLSLPLNENFNGDTFAHNPFTSFQGKQYPNIEYKWGNPSKMSLDKNMAAANVGDVFAAIPTAAGAKAKIWIPKFSTLGTMAAQVLLNIWTGDNSASTRVTATGYGITEELTVLEVPHTPGSGYQSVIATLPDALQDLDWVALTIHSDFPAITDRMVLAGYQVGKNLSSAVESTSDQAIVAATAGGILLQGHGTAEIYSIHGSKLHTVTLQGHTTLPLPSGLYLVCLQGRTHKVLVK